MSNSSTWVKEAICKIKAEQNRSADTHLIKLDIPELRGIDLYLKDESTHPTGSLKHRLARSLFLFGLCNGKIKENTTVVEASSGSTAISEAYFAHLLNLPFVAIMPEATAPKKIEKILFYGGECVFVKSANEMHDAAVAAAKERNGIFLDQFKYAEVVTDWRGNNNIAESIFAQLKHEPHPVPAYIVTGAGTGGTSATIGRYTRYQGYDSQLVVVDPEDSVFYNSFIQNNLELTSNTSSKIEGIGRPQVEKSFQADVIEEMIKVTDAASIASILWLEKLIGRKVGASTGTNLWGALIQAEKMIQNNEKGSIVAILCDGGDRYLDTYYNPSWVEKNIGDVTSYIEKLNCWLGDPQSPSYFIDKKGCEISSVSP
jgi:cysteine synthase